MRLAKYVISLKITRVNADTRSQTGLRGMSGNKGGCGVRFDLYDTSLCLMTCHLAAGHSNVAERNADYKTISHELAFQRGRRIDDHGCVGVESFAINFIHGSACADW